MKIDQSVLQDVLDKLELFLSAIKNPDDKINTAIDQINEVRATHY